MKDHSNSTFVLGWEINAFNDNEHVIISENLLIFICLLSISLLLQFYIGHVWKLTYLPEAGGTILISMFVGGLIRLSTYTSSEKGHTITEESPIILGFNPELFYFCFLPPIIFTAGFLLKRQLFYGNFGVVAVLAFLGTFITASILSICIYYITNSERNFIITNNPFTVMESIAFGCILSSTDPISTLSVFTSLKVDPSLYYAVLGESILNDAVAITGFRIALHFIEMNTDVNWIDVIICIVNFIIIIVASSIIGYILGIFFAYIFKLLEFKNNYMVPVSLFVCTVYIPFLLSEMIQLSGIITIFFSGISARRYIYKNITVEVRQLSAFIFQFLSNITETSCFVLLGLNIFFLKFHFQTTWVFFAFIMLLILASRALSIYPLLYIVNIYRYYKIQYWKSTTIANNNNNNNSSNNTIKPGEEVVTSPNPSNLASPIAMNTMHMIFFAGLRGAVAFALAYLYPNKHRNLVMCSTTIVILITIFIQGGLTEYAIHYLSIETNVDVSTYLKKHRTPSNHSSSFEKKYIYPYIIKAISSERNQYESLSQKHSNHLGIINSYSFDTNDLSGRFSDPINDEFSGINDLSSPQLTINTNTLSTNNTTTLNEYYNQYNNQYNNKKQSMEDIQSSGGGSVVGYDVDYQQITSNILYSMNNNSNKTQSNTIKSIYRNFS